MPKLAIDTYHDWWSAIWSALRLPRVRERLSRFLAETETHVVLATMPHDWNPLLQGICAKLAIPYVATVHDGEMHVGDGTGIWQWWRDKEVRQADALIALTEHVKGQIQARHGGRVGEIAVAPHGPFDAFGRSGEIGRRPNGNPRLTFFGRLLPYKGVDLLIEAFALLRHEGRPLELAIHGQGHVDELAARVATLPDVFLDARYIPDEEIPALLGESDILVLPYREASQSGVVAIAQSIGMPVVVTPVGGLIEQIAHERTGLVAEAVTAPALARAIARFLDDPGLAASCAVALRAEAQGLWSETGTVVAELLARKSSASARSFRERGVVPR